MNTPSPQAPADNPPAVTKKEKGSPLLLLVAFGLVASLIVLVLLGWYFAEQEYRRQCSSTCPGWTFVPPLSSEAMFVVVRNTVTAAAALGLGVTIVLSYRRQRVAEQTLTYTAETQRLAVEAQTLESKRMDRESLDTLRKRYLDIATLLNTKGDLNQITALHALESLIISWRQFKNDREAGACLNLLLSTMRLSRTGRTAYDKEFLQTAQRLLDRHLGEDEEGPLSWSGLTFDATFCIGGQGIKNWEVTSGEKTASPQASGPARISYSNISGGTLRLSDTSPDSAASILPSTVNYVMINGGSLRLTLTGSNPAVQVRGCIFDGGIINITSTKLDVPREVTFTSCTFDGGLVQVATTKTTDITFRQCVFNRPPVSRPGVRYSRRELVFDRCIAINPDGEKISVNSLDDMKAVFEEDFQKRRRVSVKTADGNRK